MRFGFLHGFVFAAAATLVAPTLAQEDPPTWNWSQFYVGAGGSFNSSYAMPGGGPIMLVLDGESSTLVPSVQDLSSFVLAGFTQQSGAFVFGLEGDVDLGGPSDFGRNIGACFGGNSSCATGGIDGTLDTIGHLRALVGYTPDPSLLLFGAVGVAAANASVSGNYLEAASPPAFSQTISFQDTVNATLMGISLGAGAQFRLNENISVRTEILHDAYGSSMPLRENFFSPATAGGNSADMITNGSVTFSQTTARASIIFGL